MFWVAIMVLPLIAASIDAVAGIRTRNRMYKFGEALVEDFRILVPVWGRTEYLQNIAYLSQYGSQVTLCTTSYETAAFYTELEQIATLHYFQIFRDQLLRPKARKAHAHTQRTTAGTIRDRLIRNVLPDVTEPYVVTLDADTTTCEHMSLLVGELVRRELDIASIRLVLNNPQASLLTKLQQFEYRLAMQIRFVAPWMLSGACHVAKTAVLSDVMNRHSLFFQGNDVETGIIAKARGYRVGHIPFEVRTDVPADFTPWLRQRLAWAGGEFRLFIINFQLILKHPFFWIYGGVVVIAGCFFRWLALTEPSYSLITAMALYFSLALYLNWKIKRGWMLLMPLYTLVLSMVLTPLGLIWYFKMAISGNNWGLIRPKRDTPVA